MEKLHKIILIGMSVLALNSLTACGRHYKGTKHIRKTILNRRVTKQVNKLKYQDKALAVVQFKRKPQLIEYKVYKIKNVGKVQDLAAYQTGKIEKETKDNELAPKVVMFHLSKKQMQQKKYREKMKRMAIINREIYKRSQEQTVMFRKQNRALFKQQQQQRQQLLQSSNNNNNNNQQQQVKNNAEYGQPQSNVRPIRHYHVNRVHKHVHKIFGFIRK